MKNLFESIFGKKEDIVKAARELPGWEGWNDAVEKFKRSAPDDSFKWLFEPGTKNIFVKLFNIPAPITSMRVMKSHNFKDALYITFRGPNGVCRGFAILNTNISPSRPELKVRILEVLNILKKDPEILIRSGWKSTRFDTPYIFKMTWNNFKKIIKK